MSKHQINFNCIPQSSVPKSQMLQMLNPQVSHPRFYQMDNELLIISNIFIIHHKYKIKKGLKNYINSSDLTKKTGFQSKHKFDK
jgi:hypothetical protein